MAGPKPRCFSHGAGWDGRRLKGLRSAICVVVGAGCDRRGRVSTHSLPLGQTAANLLIEGNDKHKRK